MAVSAWLDTNVLLRFLTRQPEPQASASARLLAAGQRGEMQLLLHPSVVAEVVYVLEGQYAYDRDRTANELTLLFDTEAFTCIDREAVLRGLRLHATLAVDFVDAFLASLAADRDESVATFDRDFARLPASIVSPQ